MIKIEYSKPNFKNFLTGFTDEKAETIKNRMKDYANEVYPLPFTHSCKEVGLHALKILIPDLKVVIIFEDYGDYWELVEGYSYFPRAA